MRHHLAKNKNGTCGEVHTGRGFRRVHLLEENTDAMKAQHALMQVDGSDVNFGCSANCLTNHHHHPITEYFNCDGYVAAALTMATVYDFPVVT